MVTSCLSSSKKVVDPGSSARCGYLRTKDTLDLKKQQTATAIRIWRVLGAVTPMLDRPCCIAAGFSPVADKIIKIAYQSDKLNESNHIIKQTTNACIHVWKQTHAIPNWSAFSCPSKNLVLHADCLFTDQ